MGACKIPPCLGVVHRALVQLIPVLASVLSSRIDRKGDAKLVVVRE